MINNQISFFDKSKIKLLEDWTRLHNKLTINSVWDVFIEKDESYIVLIDKTLYRVYKKYTKIC